MGHPVDSIPAGVHDATGSPAVSKVSQNQTVKSISGPIGIITDTLSFSGATISGFWIMGASRAKINGIPIVNSTSVGIGVATVPPPPTTGPLRLGQSDSRIKAL